VTIEADAEVTIKKKGQITLHVFIAIHGSTISMAQK
jgi:hypothetical protein